MLTGPSRWEQLFRRMSFHTGCFLRHKARVSTVSGFSLPSRNDQTSVQQLGAQENHQREKAENWAQAGLDSTSDYLCDCGYASDDNSLGFIKCEMGKHCQLHTNQRGGRVAGATV